MCSTRPAGPGGGGAGCGRDRAPRPRGYPSGGRQRRRVLRATIAPSTYQPGAVAGLTFSRPVGHLCLLHLPPTTSDRRPGRRLHRLPTTSESPWSGDCTVYLPTGGGGGTDFLPASRSLMPVASSAYHLRHDLAPAKRPPKVERLLADTARNRWLAAGKLGHVRWRADLRQERDAGRIELFEAAMPLADIA